MIVAFLLQAVAGPQLPAPLRPRSDKPCPVQVDTADVVVCGRQDDRYRLPRTAALPERQLVPKAELRLGSAAVAAETEAAGLPGGISVNRLMFRLKVPFGAKRKPADR